MTDLLLLSGIIAVFIYSLVKSKRIKERNDKIYYEFYTLRKNQEQFDSELKKLDYETTKQLMIQDKATYLVKEALIRIVDKLVEKKMFPPYKKETPIIKSAEKKSKKVVNKKTTTKKRK